MKRGEIWLINLDPAVGAEIKKIRPAMIINNDTVGKLPLKIIVPITDWKERYSTAPWMVKIQPSKQNGLTKISALDCFQVRSISEMRLIKRVGCASFSEITQVQQGVVRVVSAAAT
ncbi:MAG: type II toxin-antitoxin system PemK/MazF family toxin [Prevotellaceae bacterium]|jgi:mRNA interferase MazF|nr:type II toxin-antitoxin system PemK/MazF family toxin [Prevotellaceae bacterium]